MRHWLARAVACALIFPALLSCSRPATNGPVDPRQYDSFFLWAGVPPPPWLDRAKSVYILAGEVRAKGPEGLVTLRASPEGAKPAVWMVVRADRLDWSEGLHAQVLRQLDRWAARSRVEGLQVDFDAATRGIGNYGAFLRDLRRRLPKHFKLSITGLMDWSANGDPAALADLAGTVDEVVVQTYQGRHTIPGYEAYFEKLKRLPLPYRVALVEKGEWTPPAGLESDPEFRGYVVFLLRD